MLFEEIHHVAIISSDYEKAKDFYVDKLGFEVNYRHPKGCQLPGFVENCFQHY